MDISKIMEPAPLDLHSHVTWIRLGIALVWIVFGLVFKALGALPRHRQIVARVVGEPRAQAVTTLVAVGEIALGAWMIYGRWLVLCVGIQTVAIISMNALELRSARDLLLSPVGMVCANAIFLGLGWYVAFA
jgi:hypothetical protein